MYVKHIQPFICVIAQSHSFVVSHILLAFSLQEILEQSCLTTMLACSYHLMLAIAGDRWASHQDQASWQICTTVKWWQNSYWISKCNTVLGSCLVIKPDLLAVAMHVTLSTTAWQTWSLQYTIITVADLSLSILTKEGKCWLLITRRQPSVLSAELTSPPLLKNRILMCTWWVHIL